MGHRHLVHLESERDLDVPHGPKARAINHHHPHHSTTHTRAFPIISTPMKRVVGLVLVMSSTRIVVVLLWREGRVGVVLKAVVDHQERWGGR